MNDRTYEIMFIVRPDVEEADRRRLAYTVRKFNDGFYVLLTIAAEGKLITEIERRLRVSEQVIKFITVRMDEEEKRLAKIKAHRDSHVKRSAVPVQPAHPFPSQTPTASTEPASATPAEAGEVLAEPPAAAASDATVPVETPAEPVSA